MSRNNVTKLKPILMMSQQFENDGVHLTESSRKLFLETTLKKFEIFYRASIFKLDLGDEIEVAGEVPAPSAVSMTSEQKSAPVV
jgi:hypothetical protein